MANKFIGWKVAVQNNINKYDKKKISFTVPTPATPSTTTGKPIKGAATNIALSSTLAAMSAFAAITWLFAQRFVLF